jgi:hypothetical protein
MSPLRKLPHPLELDDSEAPSTLRSARIEQVMVELDRLAGHGERTTLLPPPPSDPMVVERSAVIPAAARRERERELGFSSDEDDTLEWLDDALLEEVSACDTDPCGDGRDTDRCLATDIDEPFENESLDDEGAADEVSDRSTVRLGDTLPPPSTLRSEGLRR